MRFRRRRREMSDESESESRRYRAYERGVLRGADYPEDVWDEQERRAAYEDWRDEEDARYEED
jgi:hypothetical protein